MAREVAHGIYGKVLMSVVERLWAYRGEEKTSEMIKWTCNALLMFSEMGSMSLIR